MRVLLDVDSDLADNSVIGVLCQASRVLFMLWPGAHPWAIYTLPQCVIALADLFRNPIRSSCSRYSGISFRAAAICCLPAGQRSNYFSIFSTGCSR